MRTERTFILSVYERGSDLSIDRLLVSQSFDSLLVIGKADPVTCDKHVEAYSKIANGHKVVINNCGHTPHAECPDVYCYKMMELFTFK
ncbi:alpha/beta fold hydrolase [Shouchella tritolerans]|uniref:alpha/beta fold hydrolase n=1 Tax=Shouchella tritolerans TaxID=2979466 RepID=UPI0021E77F24|nr:alpha/beta hydrolase [Shouchella tritolerans]